MRGASNSNKEGTLKVTFFLIRKPELARMDPAVIDEPWNNIQDAAFIQRRLAGIMRGDVKIKTCLSV